METLCLGLPCTLKRFPTRHHMEAIPYESTISSRGNSLRLKKLSTRIKMHKFCGVYRRPSPTSTWLSISSV